MNEDRRRQRSNDPKAAAALYLAAAAERCGLDAVTLSDDEGLLVAGAGHELDLVWLAALGSAFAGRPDEHGALTDLGPDLFAASLRVGDRTLFLAAVGGAPRMSEATVALNRILAA